LIVDGAEADAPAQWISIAKRLTRELFVNDDNARRAFFVLFGETSPAHERNSQRRKIAGRNRGETGRKLAFVRLVRRLLAPLYAVPAERQRVYHAGLTDAGNGFYLRDQLPVIIRELRMRRIFRLRDLQVHGQHTLRRETGIHPQHRDEAAQEQPA